MKLTTKENWDNYWSKHRTKKVSTVLFADLFEKYFRKDKKISCLEIGCLPGDFLIYFYKNFGYQIHGLDYLKGMEEVLEKNFQKNNVKKYQIYNRDFTSFKINQKFDVVFSAGFVEHFSNYKEIIEGHINLLSRNGLVFISLPNFRYGQYLLRKLFDKENIEKHNLKSMNPKEIRKVFKKNNLDIIYTGYYRSFKFWVDDIESKPFLTKKIITLIILIGQFFFKYINIPNRFFSPFIVCIAKKK